MLWLLVAHAVHQSSCPLARGADLPAVLTGPGAEKVHLKQEVAVVVVA